MFAQSEPDSITGKRVMKRKFDSDDNPGPLLPKGAPLGTVLGAAPGAGPITGDGQAGGVELDSAIIIPATVPNGPTIPWSEFSFSLPRCWN
jgi:hypothetical protein